MAPSPTTSRSQHERPRRAMHILDDTPLDRHMLDRLLGADPPGVVVAWSGGLDSTVLVHLLMRWGRATGAEVAAVHVDHQMRPSSVEDAAFCRRCAQQWGVGLVIESVKVNPKGSAQAQARRQRYAAVGRAAEFLDLPAVATAHHADDAVETALLHFRRGTSAGGLASGVTRTAGPIPAWPDRLRLIRPLARASRRDLRQYADRAGLSWRTDPTNQTSSYERNRLRHQVIPALDDDGAHLGPMIDTLENLADQHRALATQADDRLDRAALESPDPETAAMRCRPIRQMPAAVITHILQKLAARLPGPVGLGRNHLQRAAAAITNSEALFMAVRGAVVSIQYGYVIIEVARGRGGRHLHDRTARPIELPVDDQAAAIPWFGSHVHWHPAEASTDPAATTQAPSIPVNIRPGPLTVRGPKPGDRLDAVGIDGHKKVGDILAEAGVPRAFRWRWPCVANSEAAGEVLWVCGLRGRQPDESAGPPDDHLVWRTTGRSLFDCILNDQ